MYWRGQSFSPPQSAAGPAGPEWRLPGCSARGDTDYRRKGVEEEGEGVGEGV